MNSTIIATLTQNDTGLGSIVRPAWAFEAGDEPCITLSAMTYLLTVRT